MANEKITLTTPQSQPALTEYRPGGLHFDLEPVPYIQARLIRNSDNRNEVFEYPAPGTATDTPAKALALIEALNTANLTTRTLWRRLFDKLVADFPSRFSGGATVP